MITIDTDAWQKANKEQIDALTQTVAEVRADLASAHACNTGMAIDIRAMGAQVEELRAERERLRDALQFYAHGHHFGATDTSEPGCICLENGEIARDALASPSARNDPAEAEKIHQEGVALASLFRQIQSPVAEEPKL